MRRWARRGIAVLCLMLVGRQASAQALRGIARDSATNGVLPGVVLTVLDAADVRLARTITDGTGRFTLSLPATATHVRAIRIGFRPRDFKLPVPSGSLEFAMARIPPILDVVRVSDRELCPGSVDRGAAFQLWEQARAGLLAAVVAREANPSTTTTLVFERRMVAGDELVRRQRVERKTGRTTRPFIAFASPARFAATGYLREDHDDRLFLAPDADVLLDESFAATHCFHLQSADSAHAGQIGLAFVPVPGRPDSLVDVSGVIWLDRPTPMLRSFDFRYTGLEPAAMREDAGGHLDFVTVANGVSFIEWWALHLPILTLSNAPPRPVSDPFPPSRRRQDRRDVRATAIQEAGGQVLQADWPDGTSWRNAESGIRGKALQRGTSKPAAHVLVTLAGTNDSVTTDENGEFTMSAIVPGRYSIVASDTAFSAFTEPRSDAHLIDVHRGQMTEVRVELPTALDAISQICRGQRPLPNTTTLAGRVVLPDGSPARDGVVQAHWQADYSGQTGAGLTINNAERSITLDHDGRFLLCGVAPERPIHLKFLHSAGLADTTITSYETLLKAVEWRVTLRPPQR